MLEPPPAQLTCVSHDAAARLFECRMHPAHPPAGYRPCFSVPLLRELLAAQRWIAQTAAECGRIDHLILSSRADAFNLGGDLELFLALIRSGDADGLMDYARLCVTVAHGFDRIAEGRCHSIAVVEGDALGGGFEAALCCHTIVAEEGARMGFPEVLFDLFPGMGAYSYLTRRVSPAQAERMMLDGRLYDAGELHRMGIVDVLAPRGQGMATARALVERRRRMGNTLRSMNLVRQLCRPVQLDELLAVTSAWSLAAARLDRGAQRRMERLLGAQRRRSARVAMHGRTRLVGSPPT
jgi:DSF synthase